VAGRLDGDNNIGDADGEGGKGGEGSKSAKKTQDEIVAIMPSLVDLLFD
jgi:hypothetical protein